MKKLLFIAIAIFGFSLVSFGQSTSTQNATASAKLMKALVLTKTSDMNFGTITTTNATGSVTLPAAAAPSRGVTGGATLFGGTVAAATFTVAGDINTEITVQIPTAPIEIKLGGTSNVATEKMTVGTFVSDPVTTAGSGLTTLDVAGTSTIYVGATLSIGAGQVPGLYSNPTGGFDVTVHYN